MHDPQNDMENTSHASNPRAAPSHRHAETSNLHLENEHKEDPLLPFYAKAREEADIVVCSTYPSVDQTLRPYTIGI
jgi:hypothetical protein